MNYEYLEHHGILGQKWGVRRYQNEDGSYTPAGQKRRDREIKKASKQYDKYAKKVTQHIASKQNDIWLRAYNKSADEMNNGLIDKYNKDYEKKLGDKAKNHNYANDKKYNEGYEKLFDKVMTKNMNAETLKEFKSDPDYKKAQELCKKYSLEKVNDLAKDNIAAIKELEKLSK